MNIKKQVKHFVKVEAAKYIAHFFYFAGLASLIPILPLVLAPDKIAGAKNALITAIVLITVSFFIVLYATKSKKEALKVLGLTTLIPGLIAVIFAAAGEKKLMSAIAEATSISPYVQNWIANYVPKTWFLAGIYILLGVFLIWLSQAKK